MKIDRRLFLLTALVFLATRLVALTDWPIYFFTDEAANTVRAAEFLQHGFHDANGVLFPTYFENGQYLSLSVSVYVQVIPYALFGSSVYVTRAVVVLIALLGTLAVGLILRDIFKVRYWWLGSLLLSITPAWFLHSRTAFEHPLWVSFFACFVYFYLRYRTDRPRHLITALICGALAFYSYNGGELGLGVMGILLLIVDARYHWHTLRADRRLLTATVMVVILAALPYLRFAAEHPAETAKHLRVLESYWISAAPLEVKLGRLVQEYWNGLRPDYWFAPDNTTDLIRHQMKGYGNLLLITLPFFAVGLMITLKNLRSASYRTLLIALLIAPIGGVLVAANVLRDLVFVIPATLLTALGLIAVLDRIRARFSTRGLSIGTFGILAAFNIFMLYDAVTHGPTWYTNYELGGLQYGARQIFEAAQDQLNTQPQTPIWIAPTWLNGADLLQDFFLPDEPRVSLFDLDGFLRDQYDISDLVIVLASEDYQRVMDSGKFELRSIERTLPRPDGSIGFYFVRLSYSPQADALFAAEREARAKMITESAVIAGQTVTVTHTPFNLGKLADLFDGDPTTLVRTPDINPAVLDLTFEVPPDLSGVEITTGSMNLSIVSEINSGATAERFAQTHRNLPPDPTIELDFGGSHSVSRLHLEIRNPDADAYGVIHLRDIQFK